MQFSSKSLKTYTTHSYSIYLRLTGVEALGLFLVPLPKLDVADPPTTDFRPGVFSNIFIRSAIDIGFS